MEQLRILTLEIERMPKAFGATFGDPQGYPYLSVGTTSTHDMAPLRCWWHENPALTQRYFSEVLQRRGAAPQECSPALMPQDRRPYARRTVDAGDSPLQDWLATDVRRAATTPTRSGSTFRPTRNITGVTGCTSRWKSCLHPVSSTAA